jgi:hypothetical protein
MDMNTTLKELRLAPGESLVLEHAAGIEIQCRRGALWITQYGDARDIVLTAGRTFELSLATSTVLSSRDGAEFLLRRRKHRGLGMQEGHWGQRLLRALGPRSNGLVQRGLEGRVRVERAW